MIRVIAEHLAPHRPAGGETAFVAILLATMATALHAWHARRLRGTTLLGPWYWLLLALWAVAGSELAISLSGVQGLPGWASPLRFAAAAATLCPAIAVLGAKRPQHQAWKFIVLSLWGILALPAAEGFFMHGGRDLEIHGARAWFLWILIAVGMVNTLPTRFWGAALLFAAGQLVLLSPFLPLVRQSWGATGPLAGLGSFLAGLVWTTLAARHRKQQPDETSLDRLWFDFRDLYGVLWGLRVAERINATAAASGWDVNLGWRGFRTSDGSGSLNDLPPEVRQSLTRTFRSLLRRFVSAEWIARRLG